MAVWVHPRPLQGPALMETGMGCTVECGQTLWPGTSASHTEPGISLACVCRALGASLETVWAATTAGGKGYWHLREETRLLHPTMLQLASHEELPSRDESWPWCRHLAAAQRTSLAARRPRTNGP